MKYTINTLDREYIKKTRLRMKIYLTATLIFLATTLIFAYAWVDLTKLLNQ